jgi:membrane protease YdiL (CAAX protease family)
VDYLSNLFFIAVIASIAEEVFFRGVLQQLLSKHFKNEHVGVWLTAIVFSLMHLQFYGFLPRVMLGAMLGYLFVFTRNLWIPILIHFLNNALVVTFNFFLRDNALYKVIEDPSFNTPFVLLGISSLFLTVCAYLMLEPDPMYPTED